jgi:ammonia channel protein AmtB
VSQGKKPNWQTMRDLAAVIIVVVAAVVGLASMLRAETLIEVNPETLMLNQGMVKGLQGYSFAIGLIFLLSGIAFMLVGYRDKTDTRLTGSDEEA